MSFLIKKKERERERKQGFKEIDLPIVTQIWVSDSTVRYTDATLL